MNSLESLRILIVDDVETVRIVFKKSMKELKMPNLFEASGVQLAWDIITEQAKKNEPIDVIISDWNMPSGDGIVLLKKIRESEVHSIKWSKFVMITGSDAKVTSAMDAGANNIIHKPFDATTLKYKLNLMYSHL